MKVHKTFKGMANATRVAGNLYSVLYPGHADCDGPVPYSYLKRLARDGYTVTVDEGAYAEPGEPRSYVVTLD